MNFEGLVLKEDWIVDELITCGYSTRAELSEACRCETCCFARRRKEYHRTKRQECKERKGEPENVGAGR